MPPAERILAPIVVLAIHFLLLVDIAGHRSRLLDFSRPSVVSEWAVAVAAVLTYLRTVIGDPGFLRKPQPVKPSRLWLALGGLCWPVVSSIGLVALWRKGVGARVGSSGGVNGSSGNVRDPRDAYEARELQPIGRSALDALDGLEADSDPGEEAIEAVDLESASAAAAAVAAAPGPGGPPSLGAIPGSPRPGAGRNRAKRRENSTSRWVDAGDPGGDAAGRVMTQSGHRLRFCRVCTMYQPLRTKHCRDCGRCVRTHDHHCPWIGTCVGEGNRVYFYWFLVAQFLELFIFGLEGVLKLAEAGLDLALWVNTSPVLLIGLAFIGMLLFMVSCLLVFHSYLAMANMTTWENISWHNISYLRSLPPEDGSPFSLSLRDNLVAYCCPSSCPLQGCAGPDPVKRTEDGWAVWELGDAESPLHVKFTICGLRAGCICCPCFGAG